MQQLARPPKGTTSVPPGKWADLGLPLEQNARKPVDFAKVSVQTFRVDGYDVLVDPRSVTEHLSQFFIHKNACLILSHRVTFLQSKFGFMKISTKFYRLITFTTLLLSAICYYNP